MPRHKRPHVKRYRINYYSRRRLMRRWILFGLFLLLVSVLAWFAAPYLLNFATYNWYTVVRDRDLSAPAAVIEMAAEGASSFLR